MCHTPKKQYFAKFIQEPLPLESDLSNSIHDSMVAEIVAGSITSVQEAVDWITSTFMYRRMVRNPNYYEIAGRTPQHLNDFLSELVEEAVADLVETGFLVLDQNESSFSATTLSRIASQSYLKI
mmetsp:Transcript_18293/g.31301  ORF Transcript_18293/g.31301 Transcript_18293/m.31301 type:complete len:124 (-) Transcript_18293:1147-1518(-)